MASRFLGVGRVPEARGDLAEQVRALRDHLVQLQQGLEYALGNLGRENMNPAELARFDKRLEALEQAIRTEGTE